MIRNYILCVFMLGSIFSNAQAPTYGWLTAVGGTNDESLKDFVFDSNGDIVATGFFSKTVEFDPTLANSTKLTSEGSNDIFIAKYSINGYLKWAKRVGGSGIEQGTKVEVDKQGNIIVLGLFYGKIDFNPSTNPADTNYLIANGTSQDFFVAKYDSQGNYLWAFAVGAQFIDQGFDLELDENANIYVVGNYNNVVDFDPSNLGVSNSTKFGGSDIFIAKYSPNGNYVWAKQFGTLYSDAGVSISYDKAGHLIFTGLYLGTIDMDASASTYNLTAANGNNPIFIAKYDTSGNFIWAKSIDGNTNQTVITNVSSDNNGDIYIVGNYKGTIDMDPSASVINLTATPSNLSYTTVDTYFAKYSSIGDFIWAKSIGGNLDDKASSMYLDKNNDVFISGRFRGVNADYDPSVSGSGFLNSNTTSADDIFITRFNSNGDYQWAYAIGGALTEEATCIKTNTKGDLFFGGIFYGNGIDFDFGSGTTNISSNGTSDFFICKYNLPTPVTIENLKHNFEISAYPNPTQNLLTLNFQNLRNANIEIIDVLGKTAMVLESNFSSEQSKKVYDISSMRQGLYFIKIATNFDEHIFKLVKN